MNVQGPKLQRDSISERPRYTSKIVHLTLNAMHGARSVETPEFAVEVVDTVLEC